MLAGDHPAMFVRVGLGTHSQKCAGLKAKDESRDIIECQALILSSRYLGSLRGLLNHRRHHRRMTTGYQGVMTSGPRRGIDAALAEWRAAGNWRIAKVTRPLQPIDCRKSQCRGVSDQRP